MPPRREKSQLEIDQIKEDNVETLWKIFRDNFFTETFRRSRNSLFIFVAGPGLINLGYTILKPHSIFRRIAVGACLFGAGMSSYNNIHKDFRTIGSRDDPLGGRVRNAFNAISENDLFMSYFMKETWEIIRKRELEKKLSDAKQDIPTGKK